MIETSRLSIIKAYDVRGTVPDQLDANFARALGAAFVRVVGATKVVIGRDMRESGPGLVAAFAQGATAQGADVIDMGLASTDALYFASGHLGIPGAMVTASHNPAEYNGFKLCRAAAAPVGQDTGLADIRDLMATGVPDFSGDPGSVQAVNLIPEYAKFLRELVDISTIRPLRVVVDAGNGMAGYTVPAVLLSEAGLPALPLSLDEMYFELDGSFPNHEANPIDPDNLRDLQAEVLLMGADIGLAFDGDADRCFIVDERGELVSPSAMTALIAERELRRVPGSSVIHNLITSRAVPEVITAHLSAPAWVTRSSRTRWRARARYLAANTPGISTSEISGEPIQECWPLCTCLPHWATPLLRSQSPTSWRRTRLTPLAVKSTQSCMTMLQ